jgi:hypothetical protein
MDTEREAKTWAFRWSARLFGVVIAGFFLMAIGSSLQSRLRTGSIKPPAAIGLGLAGIYVVAMFLALQWERAAVRVGVAALLGCHVWWLFVGLFEYKGRLTLASVVDPLLLAFWIPVLLYLLCWRLEGRGRRKALL